MSLKSKGSSGTGSEESGSKTPIRTLQILEEIANEPTGIQLQTLADRLNLPKTSVFRMLKMLEQAGYVLSDKYFYSLGSLALKLGATLSKHNTFPNCALGAMTEVSQQCGETIILGTIAEAKDEVVYSAIIDSVNPLRFISTVGSKHALYGSASGLCLLAHFSDTELEQYLTHHPLLKIASGTITTKRKLLEILDSIQTQGYVVSIDGLVEGVMSIGAPIFNRYGVVEAALSISCPTVRGLENEQQLIELVKKGAQKISLILGFGNNVN